MAGDTWGDAVSYTLALQTSLKICAGRIATLNARRAGLLEKTSEKMILTCWLFCWWEVAPLPL